MAELLQAPVTSTPSEPGFAARHIGPSAAEQAEMLAAVGAASIAALIDETIPAAIRRRDPLPLPPAEREHDYLARLWTVASKNQIFRSFIGLGYYDTITPAAILRNVFENPGWYTPYTPYQAEIAQGRLESLLNFQTVVKDLTGMDVANASLLDEATSAAEGMALAHRVCPRKDAKVFLADPTAFPQTLELLAARAEPLGLELRIVDIATAEIGPDVFGVLLQSPDVNGLVRDLSSIIARVHDAKALAVVATDLLACALITPPGEMGADVVVGSAQRFGVPLGYGGPHAAFFATRDAYVRQMPGRLIGVSVDAHGKTAYRMAIQTREQHIRREKATSNICTAQALLANIAAFYAVHHGPDGLTAIARRVHGQAVALAARLGLLGATQKNAAYFDTLRIDVGHVAAVARIRQNAEAARLNFRYDGTHVGIALDETCEARDLDAIVQVFRSSVRSSTDEGVALATTATGAAAELKLPPALVRTSGFLTHPVFHAHRSESALMRYIRGLERKDIGLDTSMIPLGSCTMKLNAAAEMLPLSWPELARLHPFVPAEQAAGYHQLFGELEKALGQITGLPGVSLQPNSGAQGELAGLLVIQAWHRHRGQGHRTIALIPQSAHGTNPASAAMAGMQVVVVACDDKGNIDVTDLERKARQHADTLAALLVTYPSTHGVFEDAIQDICHIVHTHGGQVYMDGANMNAQVGLTSPAAIGADVCHINLHKTFAIPHGGGGPGMGPICVAEHLAPFLPGHPVVKTGGAKAIHAVSAAPWGSASILAISYGYIAMLGRDGLRQATEIAILNANYVKARLEPHFPILYTRATGRVAHEMILDLRPLKAASGIDETDVAKRLMDYGFHAPTVSFPVAGTLMIEPTESEPKAELDRFCDALIAIRAEIQAVIDGTADRQDNVLKQAPHTADAVTADDWTHAYSRQQAAFPLPFVKARKVWPTVARIDNARGDRQLVCACPPMSAYE